ncbi:hypothetical protein ACFSJW_01410 [Flavobacterium artemisiae]|uniref:Fibronectin type-III domain-containing protein n=1 Tax=Flavobacterium artemisiae TaxID=2126556 RepID=A0ABW4HIQ3_9FLAO
MVLKPALSWQAATDPDGDAVTYSLYLDKNAQPTTLIKAGITATGFTLVTALTHNTIYYWKVVATDAKGAKTESNVFKFTTETAANPNQPPKAFVLTAPTNNATSIALNPTLSWQAATDPDGDAITYQLYLDKNTSPTTLVKDGIAATSHLLTTALTNNTVYYWKIVVTDTKGAKTESSVFKFTTLATAPATVSLPVKTIYKNASGTVIKTSTITYDGQKRLSKTVVINNQNANLSVTSTFSYANGKITQVVDWNDPAKPQEKFVFFYDGNGMKNEEWYSGGTLYYTYEWFYRPDGGKERRIKNTSGNLVTTDYYRFSTTGNIERVVIDNVSGEDIEYTFSNYDNKLRAISGSVLNNVLPVLLLGFNGTNLPAPNNPLSYTEKSLTTGNMIASQTLEHTYNNKNQVTLMKLKDSDSGALIETRTSEYQEF